MLLRHSLPLIAFLLAGIELPGQGAAFPHPSVSFQRDVRPLLSDRCYPCHGPDAAARKGDLRLDRFPDATAPRRKGAAIVPGKPDASLLLRRALHEDPARRMPPPESKLTLTEAEIAVLSRWIASGAAYEPHWAFIPPRRSLPATLEGRFARDPLDRFIAATLQEHGLAPAPEAARERLLRRASLVLTGLPPSPAEMDSFLSDQRIDAYERAVDRLLASSRLGEHLAQDWLDTARYADTYGYQSDVDRRVWPYRDWVIDAFNRNLPYDTFLTWQLAGDLLPNATQEQRLATAFNRLHRQTNEGGSVEEEYRVEYVADRVHTAGTAFLGLTFECARCHDHKYDPISQEEYYGLFAIFDDIDECGLYSHFTNATPTPKLALPTERQAVALALAEAEVERHEALVSAEKEAAALRVTNSRTRGSRSGADAETEGSAHDDGIAPSLVQLRGHFTLDTMDQGVLVNEHDAQAPGRAIDSPKLLDGALGQGLLMDGENALQFPKVGEFTRSDPASFALWLRVEKTYDRAVVLHRSRAWTDAGSQGYQLLIEDGHLTASLIHFWPGDAISIRAPIPLPLHRWVHVVMTYDGSSRAKGLSLWIDGKKSDAETVRDHLGRSITGGGPGNLTIGQRFRDRGFAGGAVDDLYVFNKELTAIEVAWLVGLASRDPEAALPSATDPAWDAYRVDRDDEVLKAKEALRTARVQRAAVQDSLAEIMVMEALPAPRTAFVLARGQYDAPLAAVAPHLPAALTHGRHDVTDRLALARWLTAADNPLTARIAVNRFWQLVFGQGLVGTPENFGSQGAPPSHPELLDALAVEFRESGWDIKALLRRLVTSATFRQSSSVAASWRVDPENRWLSRGPARRLSAEMIRDQALLAGGLLVEKIGGPSVKPYQPPGLWQEKSGRVYTPSKGPDRHRRSLYTFWKRTSPPPSMMIFDAAKRDVCVVRRQRTSSPLQPLVLLNDPQFVEAARALAARVLNEASDDESRVALAFRCLASRAPTLAERDRLVTLLREERDAFNSDPLSATEAVTVGDDPPPADLSPTELAAMTVVCSTLLGYDACLTLR